MKERSSKENRDALREELGSYAGVSGVVGSHSELPASYLECPGGLCRDGAADQPIAKGRRR